LGSPGASRFSEAPFALGVASRQSASTTLDRAGAHTPKNKDARTIIALLSSLFIQRKPNAGGMTSSSSQHTGGRVNMNARLLQAEPAARASHRPCTNSL
jgi:hypothetical protein